MINPYLRYSLQIFYFLVPFIPLYLFSKRIGKSTGRQRVEPMILMLGFYGVIIDELLTITLDPVYSSESVPYLFLETIALIPILGGSRLYILLRYHDRLGTFAKSVHLILRR